MKKTTILAAVISAMFIFSTFPASAHDDPQESHPHKKEGKGKGSKEEMKHEHMKRNRAMHQMMLETHEIMLETIKLIGKTAKDEDTAKKAETLQHRLENLITMHKSMHDEMMGGMGGKEMRDHDMKMDHMEKRTDED